MTDNPNPNPPHGGDSRHSARLAGHDDELASHTETLAHFDEWLQALDDQLAAARARISDLGISLERLAGRVDDMERAAWAR